MVGTTRARLAATCSRTVAFGEGNGLFQQGSLDQFRRWTADTQRRERLRTQEARAVIAQVAYDAATITPPDAGAGGSHVGTIRGGGKRRRGQGPGGRVASLRGLLPVQGQPPASAARARDANRHQRGAAEVDAEQ